MVCFLFWLDLVFHYHAITNYIKSRMCAIDSSANFVQSENFVCISLYEGSRANSLACWANPGGTCVSLYPAGEVGGCINLFCFICIRHCASTLRLLFVVRAVNAAFHRFTHQRDLYHCWIFEAKGQSGVPRAHVCTGLAVCLWCNLLQKNAP